MKDPLGIVDLRQRRRSLGAVAAPARRMRRVALEFGDLPGVLVDVGKEATARLAVEARRRDEAVMARRLVTVCPTLGVQFRPVVPTIGGRIVRQLCHDSGTDCPARTNASSYRATPAIAAAPAIAANTSTSHPMARTPRPPATSTPT